MVSSTVRENGDVVTPTIRVSESLGIPEGDYRLIGWDLDATGKRVIDEICQIAVYTSEAQYSQYVMPFKNLNRPAKKRHRLDVVTMGRYRVLKNTFTNKVLKTKSEISALMDFLGWLETLKGDSKDGVILVHHEPRRVNPAILIEALTKYNLLDKFKELVKGFANGFDIASVKCANSLNGFSLRTLTRIFLDKEEELSSAADRARLALQIVEHLSEENSKVENNVGEDDDKEKTRKATVDFIRGFVQTMDAEEKEYEELKLVLTRQNSLKPIFGPLLNNMARRERQHASPLRRLLAESTIDYVQLQEAWTSDKKEGLEKLINDKVTAKKKDIDNLIEVLEIHFDPEKKPAQPIDEKKYSKKMKSEKKTNSNNNNLSGPESPDTTTVQSPMKEKIDNQIYETTTKEVFVKSED